MSGTCDTCRWWGSDYSGACGFIDTMAATKDRLSRVEIEDDDASLFVRLVTGPKFGCVKHEELTK